MRNFHTFSILVVLSLLVFLQPVYAISTAHFQYEIEANNKNVIDYHLSDEGFRIEFSTSDKNLVSIYKSGEEAMIMLRPDEKKAVKMTKSDLKKMKKIIGKAQEKGKKATEKARRKIPQKKQNQIQKMKEGIRKVEKQLQSGNIPEAQKPMLKQALKRQKQALKRYREMNNIPQKNEESDKKSQSSSSDQGVQSSFHENESTSWNGMSAQKGLIKYNGEEKGTAILLDQPPVDLKPTEKESVTGFFDFLKQMSNLGPQGNQRSIGTMSNRNMNSLFDDSSNPMGNPDFFSRMAEYNSDRKVVLKDWGRTDRPKSSFEVPGDYEVSRPMDRIGSMKSNY